MPGLWPFKRKSNPGTGKALPGPACTFCRSTHTLIINVHGDSFDSPVRTWRGRRYLTCRCLDCGKDFYGDAPAGETAPPPDEQREVDNEAELKAAEDELRREIDENDDRRFG